MKNLNDDLKTWFIKRGKFAKKLHKKVESIAKYAYIGEMHEWETLNPKPTLLMRNKK